MTKKSDMEDTPVGRLFALWKLQDRPDFFHIFDLHVNREILMARMLQEARPTSRDGRVKEIRLKLLAIEAEIAAKNL